MKENKVLLKNTVIYTIGGIGGKLCAYFLVPLYTLSMSVEDYGIADLYYLTIQIACVIGTVKIASALVRFVLEEKTEAKKFFTAAFKIIIAATVIVAILYILLGDAYFGEYGVPISYFPMLFLVCTFKEICAELTKALDHNMEYVIGGIIQSVVLLATSYVLLFCLERGIRGYIEALIFANLVSTFYYVFRMRIGQFIDIKIKSGKTMGSMIQYSVYLVPAALAYWIIQASDRYMVNYFMGSSAAGLYGVAYKIPGICATFSNFFFSAWYISTIHEKSNKKYYSEVFSVFFDFVILLAAGIIVFDKVLAKLLFQKNFYQVWEYAPILIAASLFSISYGFFEIIFAAYKDTKAIFYTTAIGAIVNIMVNSLLIPLWGIHGAGISTLFSLMSVFSLRCFRIWKRRYMKIEFGKIALKSILIIILAFTYSFAESNRVLFVGVETFFIILIQRRTLLDIVKKIENQMKRVR